MSIFLNRKRPSSRVVWPIELEKRDSHPTLLFSPGHEHYFLLLQCSGYVQAKNGVDLVEVSIFYKLEKKSIILSDQASNFYHDFYNALDIFSPKIKTLSQR